MLPFHAARLAVCVLVATLGVVLPGAATAAVAPIALSSTSDAAGALAGTADPDDWSYLMSEETRWNPCKRIGYRINLANAPRGTVSEVKTAFRRVHAETGLRFVYRGTSSVLPGGRRPRPYAKGTDIVLAWSTPRKSSFLPDGAAAFAGASAYEAAGQDGEQAWGLKVGYAVLNQRIYLSRHGGRLSAEVPRSATRAPAASC